MEVDSSSGTRGAPVQTTSGSDSDAVTGSTSGTSEPSGGTDESSSGESSDSMGSAASGDRLCELEPGDDQYFICLKENCCRDDRECVEDPDCRLP